MIYIYIYIYIYVRTLTFRPERRYGSGKYWLIFIYHILFINPAIEWIIIFLLFDIQVLSLSPQYVFDPKLCLIGLLELLLIKSPCNFFILEIFKDICPLYSVFNILTTKALINPTSSSLNLGALSFFVISKSIKSRNTLPDVIHLGKSLKCPYGISCWKQALPRSFL